jgi:catechol 2,3-dioxygenase-like lactoylglutathione lyase family enzyme
MIDLTTGAPNVSIAGIAGTASGACALPSVSGAFVRGDVLHDKKRERICAMVVRLNHTIVAAHDKNAAALFLTEILGLPAPSVLGPFAVVQVGDDTSLDYMETEGDITSQHYAFLVSEIEFDEIFGRIRERRLAYWADPSQQQRGQINSWDDGRGVYIEDPNGHLLEILTRPYGSGRTAASHPHPLVTYPLRSDDGEDRSGQGKNAGKRGLRLMREEVNPKG